MNEEELQRDILFQIDMQLYDKYNETIAGMNDHLGDIYTYRDIEEVEKAEREEKIYLLTRAIKDFQYKISKKIKELEEEGTKEYWTEEIIQMFNELLGE